MRAETRTKKQIEANKLDLDVFRVVGCLDRFADEFNDRDVREMAGAINAMRSLLRKHMHRKDYEATS